MKLISPRNAFFTAALGLTFFLAACGDNQQPTAQQTAEDERRSFTQAMEEAHAGMGDIPMGSDKAVVPFAELEVAKATGDNAYTVSELFAQGEGLSGQTVRVKAQVVKYSPAIMNRNFIHLQDGTGSETQRTHNLVATSQEAVEVGEIVTLEGVLAANKDFGAGYTYQVILEDVTVIE
ncbi:hypothetical protein [Desulfurivibrio alkaliphilus]|uniref:Nucleic acid binding OB-fold tRNA/helicase-type n=1 Tax=Desulfurivibrio alkaliphilus (strain DSM 19089 / UNIQEM U267 / AHT2) TaxID=589865 RepID=D6Z0C2_DESAT|nr:hypothetical protein [Desulfurivibrio alkaliphilus]ADH87155.1 nucleic acid binding OB-fold tRNA/helicase-type [Desulfurivibrio alkaliphilus AHT 2]